ncbi:MAG TPA: hypothetical protein VFW42_07350, partial [Fluviicoccus sp.]|nr:hypothetical protein [Fluviicoccus sp.]
MTPTPPVIPGYTVHGLLGRGGMAEVWLATQDSLQRKVAMKLLLDSADGVIVIKAQRFRSLEQNRDDAIARLKELLTLATHVLPPRTPTRPT